MAFNFLLKEIAGDKSFAKILRQETNHQIEGHRSLELLTLLASRYDPQQNYTQSLIDFFRQQYGEAPVSRKAKSLDSEHSSS